MIKIPYFDAVIKNGENEILAQLYLKVKNQDLTEANSFSHLLSLLCEHNLLIVVLSYYVLFVFNYFFFNVTCLAYLNFCFSVKI